MRNSEKPVCSKCKKEIFDERDALIHNGKIYCPICYVKALKKGPSSSEVIMWILGILLLIFIIFTWIAYFILAVYS